MSLLRLYLCGPITGLDYGTATDWRTVVDDTLGTKLGKPLEDCKYKVISPLRGKEYLKDDKNIADAYEELPMSSSKGIFGRDQFDVARCDVLFVNFLGATKVSIGSCMEIQKAYDLGKYILVAMEKDNPNNHSFVREAASLIVVNFNYAIQVLETLALGYTP